MELRIQSPHTRLSVKLEQAVREKAAHFEKLYSRIETCDITLIKENATNKNIYKVEAKISLPQKTIFVSKSAESFENALDALTATANHQLQQFKELQDERR